MRASFSSPLRLAPRAAAAALLLLLPTLGPAASASAAAAAASAAAAAEHRTGHKAVLFGATGAVGSEVLRALLRERPDEEGVPRWSDVVLIGRREVDSSRTAGGANAANVTVTQVVVPDLAAQAALAAGTAAAAAAGGADACFIAIGSGRPQEQDLGEWHAVDVDMVGAAARLCGAVGARYVSVLSAVDAEERPEPFGADELGAAGGTGPMGWGSMLVRYARMKGLSERAVASSGVPHACLVRPSNLVTDDIRYGWLDWTLFRILPYIDPLLPARYRSVPVRLLGLAMVGDAVEVLSRGTGNDDQGSGQGGAVTVSNLGYEDFVRIAGEEYERMVLEVKVPDKQEL
jgi:hypothetical protein